MDKTGQLFNIFDPVGFKIFKKIIHNKSLPMFSGFAEFGRSLFVGVAQILQGRLDT
jgi:hypothetical protein